MQDSSSSRRRFLLGAAVAPLGLSLISCARAADTKTPRSADVLVENFSAAGVSTGTVRVPRIVKADDEWRQQLTDLAFLVARRSGTERPFTGKYNDNHADGTYRCICCATTLFDSKHKFDSGTGWPSFWKPLSKVNVEESAGGSRMFGTEVHCVRCAGHLGHVFEDGPDPTGLRYCINSVSIDFASRA